MIAFPKTIKRKKDDGLEKDRRPTFKECSPNTRAFYVKCRSVARCLSRLSTEHAAPPLMADSTMDLCGGAGQRWTGAWPLSRPNSVTTQRQVMRWNRRNPVHVAVDV